MFYGTNNQTVSSMAASGGLQTALLDQLKSTDSGTDQYSTQANGTATLNSDGTINDSETQNERARGSETGGSETSETGPPRIK